MALLIDPSAYTVLALCEDCPPWWALTRTEDEAELRAIAHAYAVHERADALRLAGALEARRRRRTLRLG